MNLPTSKTGVLVPFKQGEKKTIKPMADTTQIKDPSTNTSQSPQIFNTLSVILKGINDIRGMKGYNETKDITNTDLLKEESSVDWQERYIDKLDRDVSDMKASLKATEDRIAGMINQTLGEMRDRDNQRHAEVLGLKSDIQAIRSDNAETRRWVIGMVISAIGVALAAIIGVVSVILILR